MNKLKFQSLVLTLSALLIPQLLSCALPRTPIHDSDDALPGAALVTGKLEITDLPEEDAGIFETTWRGHITIKNLDKPDFIAYHDLLNIPPQKKFFYWYLQPGRYEIDKLFFSKSRLDLAGGLELSVRRGVRLNFSVPENVPTVYIGSVIMSVKSQDYFMRNFEILNEIKEAEMAYNEKFKNPGVKLHKNLMSWNPPR